MPSNTENDPTDAGTLRPNIKPLPKAGHSFTPMFIPDFAPKIVLPEGTSADDPATLFFLYYPKWIIDQIVLYTN